MKLKPAQARELIGNPLLDSHGDQVGEVDGVYFDGASGDLAWVSFAVDDEHKFVPAAEIATGEQTRMSFSRDALAEQPRIRPHDGALSNAQVARLHEFFHTFDGRTRIIAAPENEPIVAAVPEPGETMPFTGRVHEPAFGTGQPGPGEPHDVTLQGTGNPAP
ncbi:PRC-barrel domain-containing protein [Kineosporia babensis]|uniref:PRC-barrel domain-containing protein n=1 Tax=Kineosporia babensis TaxID=499548 RepID=A0A9X1NH19_9ACTN|nr:PRC-barrel domain-containing protein [Kineosporia babensis]MCD5313895.1 PRC-barrel domain-containing protein [Kineosporia babensis]